MSPQSLCRHKLRVFLVYIAAYSFFYILPNLFPFSPPNYLPMYRIDMATPLLPWTFLIYVSDYFLIFATITLLPSLDSFRAFSRQAFLVLFICGTFFLLYPTTYPRPPYPDPNNFFYGVAMNVIQWADTPNNCFPSMHVSLTGIAAWSLRLVRPKLFPFFIMWCLAICVSTLTTKQHYILDVIGGIAVIVFVALTYWAVYERSSIVQTRW